MVTNSIFVYHFLILTWWCQTFSGKHKAVENGSIEFKIGDINTPAHLYLRLKKTSFRAWLLFYCFWWLKIAFKILFGLYFHSSIIEFRIKEKIHSKVVVDVYWGTEGTVFLFSWERLGGVSKNIFSLVKL